MPFVSYWLQLHTVGKHVTQQVMGVMMTMARLKMGMMMMTMVMMKMVMMIRQVLLFMILTPMKIKQLISPVKNNIIIKMQRKMVIKKQN